MFRFSSLTANPVCAAALFVKKAKLIYTGFAPGDHTMPFIVW